MACRITDPDAIVVHDDVYDKENMLALVDQKQGAYSEQDTRRQRGCIVYEAPGNAWMLIERRGRIYRVRIVKSATCPC